MTVIATAGHVDHGKSSLVRSITGIDPDRLPEERRTGRSIDLGFASVKIEGTLLSFVDVPGHLDFINSMIAGVHSIDLVVLVVDAREGWMAQTQEHLGICEALGIGAGIVVITRCDLVDESMLALRIEAARRAVESSSINWTGPIVTSARTGCGMGELLAELVGSVSRMPHRELDHRFRMYVDRVFEVKGRGTVVTGTVDSGSTSTGSEISVGATPSRVRVREIQLHGDTVDQADPRQRCALNVVGPDVGRIGRGSALVSPGEWEAVRVFDAVVTVLSSADRPLRRRGAHLLHIGTSMQSVSLYLGGTREVLPASQALVRIVLPHPLPIRRGDRFVIRDASVGATVAGGQVLEVEPNSLLNDCSLDDLKREPRSPVGWIDVDQWRRRTGQALPETFAGWFVDAQTLASAQRELRDRIDSAVLFDISSLDQRTRSVLETLGEVSVVNGFATMGGPTALETHPLVQFLAAFGIEPPNPKELDSKELSQLSRTGALQESDGRYFATTAILSVLPLIDQLRDTKPEGFTLVQLRDQLETSRRTAVSIGEILDRMGITKRKGDRRFFC